MGRMRGDYDVVVVGGGPGGMAAALGARESGAERVLIVDREPEPGGFLVQCIHAGFGLHHFGEELTGPEYAERFLEQVLDQDIDLLPDSYVAGLAVDTDRHKQVRVLSGTHGAQAVTARSVVLATGCRDRTRAGIRIPGERPAGVYTAGLAQKLINQWGYLPGRRVVILGSGDVGLMMARRLMLEGSEVLGVFELLPYSNGLGRNIVECLEDFGIPLHLSTTVTHVHGHERVERVTVAPVDEHMQPIPGRGWDIPCDTLVVSIGLIPETELYQRLAIGIDPNTSGPIVSSTLETSMPGVFACGNSLHVHDLVDYVTAESLDAGRYAGEWARGIRRPGDNVRLVPGDNVRYCLPHTLSPGREHTVYLRVKAPRGPCRIVVGGRLEQALPFVVPAEMIMLRLRPELLEGLQGDTLRIDVLDAPHDSRETPHGR